MLSRRGFKGTTNPAIQTLRQVETFHPMEQNDHMGRADEWKPSEDGRVISIDR